MIDCPWFRSNWPRTSIQELMKVRGFFPPRRPVTTTGVHDVEERRAIWDFISYAVNERFLVGVPRRELAGHYYIMSNFKLNTWDYGAGCNLKFATARFGYLQRTSWENVLEVFRILLPAL